MKTTCKLISTMAPAVLASAVLLLSVPARGDMILSIESVTGAPGSTGTFDVLLTNTGPSLQNIAAFNFELTTADTNITFNDVTTSTTTAPYIFPSSSYGPDIVTFAIGQTVEAGDVTNDPTLYGTDVASGAAYPQSSLSDNNFTNVPFTAESGTITVQTSTVPEPVTAIPLAGAVLLGASLIRQRRRQ